uniref:Uncharacterized protein n=1 Tax=Siphoviridae sp. ctHip2 TaxID=2827830 RepID=A0A8S5RWA3_9CAUD|nr:MAG TPA: protein of unknown function (DUF4903) [Siphoviridae sp. ctHip2]
MHFSVGLMPGVIQFACRCKNERMIQKITCYWTESSRWELKT